MRRKLRKIELKFIRAFDKLAKAIDKQNKAKDKAIEKQKKVEALTSTHKKSD